MAIEILLIGDVATATRRLNELRMRGFPTWLATTEAELVWLIEKAAAHPSHAVVELAPESDSREAILGSRAAVAILADLPTVLIGAHPDETRYFPHLIATFPADPSCDEIIAALRRVPGR